MSNKTLQQRLDEERAKSPITKKSQRAINSTHQNADRKLDPEYQQKFKEMMASEEYLTKVRTATQTEEYRKLKSEQSKQLWQDEDYKAKQLAYINTPEVKANQQLKAKEREARPEFAKLKREVLAPTYKDPERNRKISEKEKNILKDNPEQRKIMSERAIEKASKRTKEDYQQMHKKKLDGGWLQNIQKSAKSRSKSIIAGGIPFETRKDAIKHYGFDPAMIQYNMKKDPANWYYITQEEYQKLKK